MVIYFHRHTTILTSTLSFIWDTEINILHFFFFLPQVWLPVFYNLQYMSPECFLNHDLICQGKATSHLFLFLCLAMKWMPRCNNLNGALLKIECGNRWTVVCLLWFASYYKRSRWLKILFTWRKTNLGCSISHMTVCFTQQRSVVAE